MCNGFSRVLTLGLMVGVLLFSGKTWSLGSSSGSNVGIRSAQVSVPERGQAVEVTYWYPAATGGVWETVGANAVFLGEPAQRNAPAAQGRFPLLVLAHGGLRAARYSGAWLAAELVKRGYWVLQVHAPVLKRSDAALALREAWLRPADVSAALNDARQQPWVSLHIWEEGAGVVGLMRGGTTAVMLAGGRLDPARHARMCDEAALTVNPDCRWLIQQGAEPSALDSDGLAQSHANQRVLAAVVIAPELGSVFSHESLASIDRPVHLMSLGRLETVPSYLDAARLAAVIPNATHQALEQANAFSAFARCTDNGAALLLEEGEDPALCEEAGSRSRRALHAELAARIDAALRPTFERAQGVR